MKSNWEWSRSEPQINAMGIVPVLLTAQYLDQYGSVILVASQLLPPTPRAEMPCPLYCRSDMKRLIYIFTVQFFSISIQSRQPIPRAKCIFIKSKIPFRLNFLLFIIYCFLMCFLRLKALWPHILFYCFQNIFLSCPLAGIFITQFF